MYHRINFSSYIIYTKHLVIYKRVEISNVLSYTVDIIALKFWLSLLGVESLSHVAKLVPCPRVLGVLGCVMQAAVFRAHGGRDGFC